MGFDRAEYLDTLKTVTGQERDTVLPTQRAHFGVDVDAVELIHEIAKEQELEDLFKGMRDEGGVLSGGRQRRNGRNEFADIELLSGMDGYDSVLLQSTMDSLNDLRAIDARLEQVWEQRMDLAEKYLDADTLERRPGETTEQYRQRITEALREKQADMLPEDAALLDENLAEESALKRNREAIVQELRQRQNEYDLVNMLSLRQQELATNLRDIDRRLDDNDRLRSRVSNLRGRNSEEAEAEIADIIEERDDLEIDIPEDATTAEKIQIVETALSSQSTDLESQRATTEVELVEVARDQQMLSEEVLSSDEQMALERENNAALDGAGADKNAFMQEAGGLQGGWNMALGSDVPLDAPAEDAPSTQEDTQVADLNLNSNPNPFG
ncbi:MAG: hypothetical protein JKY71_03355 [Alphaproteobacteria bacterium]|nr:hypothetical protein [Alphaproteobacteria bacterium]